MGIGIKLDRIWMEIRETSSSLSLGLVWFEFAKFGFLKLEL